MSRLCWLLPVFRRRCVIVHVLTFIGRYTVRHACVVNLKLFSVSRSQMMCGTHTHTYNSRSCSHTHGEEGYQEINKTLHTSISTASLRNGYIKHSKTQQIHNHKANTPSSLDTSDKTHSRVPDDKSMYAQQAVTKSIARSAKTPKKISQWQAQPQQPSTKNRTC